MAAIDTDGFAAAVEDELSTEFSDSELDADYCQNAGSIGDVEISGLSLGAYANGDEEIAGTFDISFSESYYNGCRDLEWRLPWSGTGSFTIGRSTGEMKIDIEAERLPEEDEDSDE